MRFVPVAGMVVGHEESSSHDGRSTTPTQTNVFDPQRAKVGVPVFGRRAPSRTQRPLAEGPGIVGVISSARTRPRRIRSRVARVQPDRSALSGEAFEQREIGGPLPPVGVAGEVGGFGDGGESSRFPRCGSLPRAWPAFLRPGGPPPRRYRPGRRCRCSPVPSSAHPRVRLLSAASGTCLLRTHRYRPCRAGALQDAWVGWPASCPGSYPLGGRYSSAVGLAFTGEQS